MKVMPNWLILIIVGIVALVVAYYAVLPPPVKMVFNIVGWIALAVGALLFLVGILNLA